MRGQVMLRSAPWRRRAELLLCPFLGCAFCCFPTAQIHAQQATPAAAQSQQPGPEAPAANSTADQTQLPQIVVSGDKPKATAKPKRNVNASAPKPVAQNVSAPAQD